MKTVAIVQARMGSSRLPGKVMRVLGDTTVLGHVIGRAHRIEGVDGVVVATTEGAADQVVTDEARRHGATVFRGSEQDVLARFHGAAQEVDARTIIRITSDCPLLDPDILSRMVQVFDASRPSSRPIDYMSNALDRTFPRGLDGEVFTRAALERANKEATLPYEREHVTPYIYEHRDLFNVVSFRGADDHSHYRLTLDTPEDWELIAAVYSKLHCPGKLISTSEVIELLDGDPALAAINSAVRQKPLHGLPR